MTDDAPPTDPQPTAARRTKAPPWWFGSPVVLAVATAVLGLLGTGVGVVMQAYSSTKLERQKFEFTLIQKALDTKDRTEAAHNLEFLIDTGAIQTLDKQKISELAKSGNVPVGFETSKAEMLRDSLKSDVESYLVENRTLLAAKEILEREVEKLKSTTATPGGS